MTPITDIFLNLILGVLSYIIPKNKKQIVLGSERGNEFFGNPKYFYLYLLNHKNYFNRIFWITKNQKIYSELKERELPVLHLYSLKGFIAILRSNFLIASHSTYDVSFFFIFQEDLIKFKPGMEHL